MSAIATAIGAAVGPVAGLIDSFYYSPQEQARDAVNAEMARSQSELARAQLQVTRDNVEIAKTEAAARERVVIIAAGAGIAAVALLVLLR